MSNLTKGMYADYKTDIFDIRYNQIRTDALITNAGWFNSKGEKLGFGDLNSDDMDTISGEVECNEIFIALSEADTTWDMPQGLDRNDPGIEYVMKRAKWVISGVGKTEGMIFHVRPDHHFGDSVCNTIYKDSVEQHYECSRDYLFESLEFRYGRFANIKPTPTAIAYSPGAHYGLDTYELTDGTKWAIGNWTQVQQAAIVKAVDYLHIYVRDRSLLNKIAASLSEYERDIIYMIADNYGYGSLSSLNKLLSEKMVLDFSKHVFGDKTAAGLLSTDGGEHYTNSIKGGLPKDLFAYKVSS